MSNAFIPVKEAVERGYGSAPTIQQLVKRNAIRSFKNGRYRYVSVDDLDARRRADAGEPVDLDEIVAYHVKQLANLSSAITNDQRQLLHDAIDGKVAPEPDEDEKAEA